MGTNILESITVKELLDNYPDLMSTFIDLGMMCVGCPADAFHTLTDVAKEYNLDKRRLIEQLEKAVENSKNKDHAPSTGA